MYSGIQLSKKPMDLTDDERLKAAAETLAQTLDYIDALGVRLVMDPPFPAPKNKLVIQKATIRLKMKMVEEPNDELPGAELRDFLASQS